MLMDWFGFEGLWDFRIKMALWGICVIIVAVVLIVRIIGSVLKMIDELRTAVYKLEIQKQDDTSAYITDEEWLDLCKCYDVELTVKPRQNLTHDSAVRLLEYLKQRKDI